MCAPTCTHCTHGVSTPPGNSSFFLLCSGTLQGKILLGRILLTKIGAPGNAERGGERDGVDPPLPPRRMPSSTQRFPGIVVQPCPGGGVRLGWGGGAAALSKGAVVSVAGRACLVRRRSTAGREGELCGAAARLWGGEPGHRGGLGLSKVGRGGGPPKGSGGSDPPPAHNGATQENRGLKSAEKWESGW